MIRFINKGGDYMEIRRIREEEMQIALKLVWKTFMEYEAPDYTKEGVQEFKKTIDDKKWINEREFWGAFENDEVIGVIATKDKNHIALFFVDGNYHRKGIGKQLYKKVCKFNKSGFFTVNSSPYAHEVYKHLGFQDVSEEQEVCGMRFFPMKALI